MSGYVLKGGLGVDAQAAKRWHALTSLKELDVSYCSLSTSVLSNVLSRGFTLQVRGCFTTIQNWQSGCLPSGAPYIITPQGHAHVGHSVHFHMQLTTIHHTCKHIVFNISFLMSVSTFLEVWDAAIAGAGDQRVHGSDAGVMGRAARARGAGAVAAVAVGSGLQEAALLLAGPAAGLRG